MIEDLEREIPRPFRDADDAVAAREREPARARGEEIDQDEADQIERDRREHHHQRREDLQDAGVALPRRGGAEQRAEHEGDQRGRHHQAERPWHGSADQVG